MKQIIMSVPSHDDATLLEFRQWNDLRNMLLDVGVDVIVMQETPSKLPESVFVGDMGVIYKNDFIVGRFKCAQRRADERHIAQWFEEHRFDLLYHPSFSGPRPDTFEGGDALLSHDRKHLWFGFGTSSSYNFKRHLDDLFDEEDLIVRPVMIRDSRFSHLNACFNPLATGELLWYPDAFDSHSRMIIESWYDGKIIEVSEDDALRNVCSSISIKDVLIVSKISQELLEKLEARGYDVIQVNVSEFKNSCKRLINEVLE